MFSPVEAFLMLSYTGMVYVLSCRGFLFCYRTQGWWFYPVECMFSPVEAFLMLSYTGSLLWCLDGPTQRCYMFSPVEAFLMLSYTVMVYVLSCRGFIDVIVHREGVCSLL